MLVQTGSEVKEAEERANHSNDFSSDYTATCTNAQNKNTCMQFT